MIDEARKLVSEVLGLDFKHVNEKASIDNLEDWNSIKHIAIIQVIENHVQRQLSIEEIISATNIEGITKVLNSEV